MPPLTMIVRSGLALQRIDKDNQAAARRVLFRREPRQPGFARMHGEYRLPARAFIHQRGQGCLRILFVHASGI